MNGLERMNNLDVYSDVQFMRLDLTARRNLELLETMRNKEKRGSLLGVLDHTRTAMGKRLMRSWIEQPLINPAQISRRHNAVDELVHDTVMRGELTDKLSDIYDLERIMTRIVYGSAMPKELRSFPGPSLHGPHQGAAAGGQMRFPQRDLPGYRPSGGYLCSHRAGYCGGSALFRAGGRYDPGGLQRGNRRAAV